MLAPVGKTYYLPANYAPATKPTGIPGGGSMVSEAKEALVGLYNDIVKHGYRVHVRSGFRSYSLQQSLFNNYVAARVNSGQSHASAVAAVNYSVALPGHSEHQLGTTVDLAGSAGLFDFVEKNAHKYGFTISYPRNKTNLTGYAYEPWHLRYIGRDLAKAVHKLGYLNSDNDLTVEKFLMEWGEF
jgi:D-alanyl-D-alanine carboxypeptidase